MKYTAIVTKKLTMDELQITFMIPVHIPASRLWLRGWVGGGGGVVKSS